MYRSQQDKSGVLQLHENWNFKVVTASKTEQTFSDTAVAVFVIHQTDLRRSGATNIPEAGRAFQDNQCR
jgi:iron complex outermembrane receptor protein